MRRKNKKICKVGKPRGYTGVGPKNGHINLLWQWARKKWMVYIVKFPSLIRQSDCSIMFSYRLQKGWKIFRLTSTYTIRCTKLDEIVTAQNSWKYSSFDANANHAFKNLWKHCMAVPSMLRIIISIWKATVGFQQPMSLHVNNKESQIHVLKFSKPFRAFPVA